MSGGTTVERLARIEALLEEHVGQSKQDRGELLAKIEKLEADNKVANEALNKRLTEIEGYKNRAYGMLIAFGLVAGGAGAGITKAVSALFQ